MHGHRHHGLWREMARGRHGPFGAWAHEPREHRGHHGPGGRIFDQGDLRWVILDLIAHKPSHGYELIKTIEERLGGAYSPSPGVIYPTLALLEELGYVAPADTDGPRRAFTITVAGREALEQNAAALAALRERMDRVAQRGGQPAPQIVRAMENLRTALRLRLERSANDPELIARVAAVLDGAARDIERD